jgi:hypothetical protein
MSMGLMSTGQTQGFGGRMSVDTAGCDAICLMPGVRGTSGRRDGAEEKMAPWAPRLMLMSGSLGRRAATLPRYGS